ncbi:hypothetical protein C8Q75DRAFT_557893 [Abortiporus biennis]|nr:hypothetical protein C8Q75DRAFT_557893 [Abortiporus biennis]
MVVLFAYIQILASLLSSRISKYRAKFCNDPPDVSGAQIVETITSNLPEKNGLSRLRRMNSLLKRRSVNKRRNLISQSKWIPRQYQEKEPTSSSFYHSKITLLRPL